MVDKLKKNKKSEKDIVQDYLKKLSVELVMGKQYTNGWYIKWVEDKIKEIESRND